MFSPSLSGMISLYERRFEKSVSSANDLKAIITTIRELWAEVSTAEVYDQRLATWLEEYFQELGIDASMQVILRFLRTSDRKGTSVSDFIGEEQPLSAEDIASQMPKAAEDVRVTGKSIIVSNLPERMDEREILYHSLLAESQRPVRTEIATTSTFIGPDGKEICLEQTAEAVPDQDPTDLILETKLENTYGGPLRDVRICNVIPFDLRVTDYDISVPDMDAKKTLTDDGLSIAWELPEIETGDEVAVRYHLRRRVNRTVMIQKGGDLNVFVTYEDINETATNRFETMAEFLNSYDQAVQELRILDEIPAEYQITQSHPSVEEPAYATVETTESGMSVIWQHQGIAPNDNITHHYVMSPHPYVVVMKKRVTMKGSLVAVVNKLVKPTIEENEYKILLEICNASEDLKNLVIVDFIPEGFEIRKTFPEDALLAQKVDDKKGAQLWWTIPELAAKETLSLAFSIRGDAKVDIQSVEFRLGNAVETKVTRSDASTEKLEAPIPAVLSQV